MTSSTPFHQAYWAHQLTLRQHPSSAEELGSTIAGARIYLNLHQIDAAFVFLRLPVSGAEAAFR